MLDKPIRCPWCSVKLWLFRVPQPELKLRCPMCGNRYFVHVVRQALQPTKTATQGLQIILGWQNARFRIPNRDDAADHPPKGN
jgi:DNA-directed RNA polymerase subunit RPC12/RpoP